MQLLIRNTLDALKLIGGVVRDEWHCVGCGADFDLGSNTYGLAMFPIAVCPECGREHVFGDLDRHLAIMDRAIDESEGRIVVTDSEIRVLQEPGLEHWVQRYIKDVYASLGFTKINGPFPSGPDFKAWRDDLQLVVEVEVTCRNYLLHGHHEDPRFSAVDLLIVLEPDEPTAAERHLYPDELMVLDRDDFDQWLVQAKGVRSVEIQRQREKGVALAKLWVRMPRVPLDEVCPDTDRDMAMCPDCDVCPYFLDEPAGV